MADETREERLARALRDNLRRRKAQARAGIAPTADPAEAAALPSDHPPSPGR